MRGCLWMVGLGLSMLAIFFGFGFILFGDGPAVFYVGLGSTVFFISVPLVQRYINSD